MKKIILLLVLFIINPSNSQSNKKQSSSEKYLFNIITKKEFESKRNQETLFINKDSIKHPKIDDKIILELNNDKKIILLDNSGIPYDENRINYKYVGYIDLMSSYLIRVKKYDDTFYLLINILNGKEIILQSYPLISPNKKYLITCYLNQFDELENINPPFNEIIIYSIKGSNLKKIVKKNYKHVINEMFWGNDNKIYFKVNLLKSETINYLALKIN